MWKLYRAINKFWQFTRKWIRALVIKIKTIYQKISEFWITRMQPILFVLHEFPQDIIQYLIVDSVEWQIDYLYFHFVKFASLVYLLYDWLPPANFTWNPDSWMVMNQMRPFQTTTDSSGLLSALTTNPPMQHAGREFKLLRAAYTFYGCNSEGIDWYFDVLLTRHFTYSFTILNLTCNISLNYCMSLMAC